MLQRPYRPSFEQIPLFIDLSRVHVCMCVCLSLISAHLYVVILFRYVHLFYVLVDLCEGLETGVKA